MNVFVLKESHLTWLMREILIDGHHVMELSIWLKHVSMKTYTPIEVIYVVYSTCLMKSEFQIDYISYLKQKSFCGFS